MARLRALLRPNHSPRHLDPLSQAFLAEWPVNRLLAALGAPTPTDAHVSLVTTVVTRVFSARAVASAPAEDVVNGFQHAAHAPDYRFRRLAVECAGAALRSSPPPGSDTESGSGLLGLLEVCVGGLGDEDTGVGAAATECLLKMGECR